MKIGINLAAKILKENIVEEINASGCPITIVVNILNELGADARQNLAKAIQAETAALQETTKLAAATEENLKPEKDTEKTNVSESDTKDNPHTSEVKKCSKN